MKPDQQESILLDMQCTVERLELEAVAATIRIENDAREIEGWKADQKENLKNQCDLVANRELLDLAAKASGRWSDAWVWSEDVDAFVHRYSKPGYGYWNPLIDDGDALRLAVKLEFGIAVFPTFVEVSDGLCIDANEKTESDPCAATRRAIVRAAAEIGRNMK